MYYLYTQSPSEYADIGYQYKKSIRFSLIYLIQEQDQFTLNFCPKTRYYISLTITYL